MRKLLLIILLIIPINIYAARGCCSRNGGVCGSCIYTVKGCMDPQAKNYKPEATVDDGSCKYDIKGCMNMHAENYNPEATVDDNSCVYEEKVVEEIKKENESGDSIIGLLSLGALSYGGYTFLKRKRK